ncbi:hypothetical protein A2U01_0083043 [Trifolium medium]|uniref:Uncharacterized protein n=1 Tax=Trifolium medium TaxID=97028 RepID=A0A392TNR6_9FABA|nr:hypothetical protein [Trifolium medium]
MQVRKKRPHWRQPATAGDNRRRLATSSPPPHLATSGDLKNGARRHLATDTQNKVF